ncbi:YqaA family protein [Nitrosophilus alvini]|uniref:YqaA family protein n=1 Tax=Nitrosophilus alvini TaxID=2714855 RepID=UPI00190A2CC9|nr:YqaA family protein [Nitrosophilus alvini]
MLGYFLLFLSAFAAATFLPVYSEGMLVYYLHQGLNPWILLLSASIGNTLGSLLNYYIGLKGTDYLVRKKYLKADQIEKAQSYFDRFGPFALLLSWAPVIGDPITFIAGVMHYSLKKFLILVFLAKLGRYWFVLQGYNLAVG